SPAEQTQLEQVARQGRTPQKVALRARIVLMLSNHERPSSVAEDLGISRMTVRRPFHDATFTVTHCGRICFKGRKVNLSHVFAGQNVGVTQVGERIWLVTFMQYDLGYFDDETCRLEPIENPFGPKVLPMSPE